jgi:hypothetical protein
MAYLTQTEFSLYTLVPPEFVARIETQYPGFIDGQLRCSRVSRFALAQALRGAV